MATESRNSHPAMSYGRSLLGSQLETTSKIVCREHRGRLSTMMMKQGRTYGKKRNMYDALICLPWERRLVGAVSGVRKYNRENWAKTEEGIKAQSRRIRRGERDAAHRTKTDDTYGDRRRG
ncbi:unnamed protein product [Pleuronectes platessa]|uniref:Uncharacterized protein n=1 Tax=Pleuronectes platessa TaxID=8262 RepID=A0A9N7VLN3_PLEPL|nr:unnamed protein product [Pleuronectes platessa]